MRGHVLRFEGRCSNPDFGASSADAADSRVSWPHQGVLNFALGCPVEPQGSTETKSLGESWNRELQDGGNRREGGVPSRTYWCKLSLAVVENVGPHRKAIRASQISHNTFIRPSRSFASVLPVGCWPWSGNCPERFRLSVRLGGRRLARANSICGTAISRRGDLW